MAKDCSPANDNDRNIQTLLILRDLGKLTFTLAGKLSCALILQIQKLLLTQLIQRLTESLQTTRQTQFGSEKTSEWHSPWFTPKPEPPAQGGWYINWNRLSAGNGAGEEWKWNADPTQLEWQPEDEEM